MKKLSVIILCAICAAFFASCTRTDYNTFVGTWGVEKIQYYNIDYAGNPITATIHEYTYDPEDADNGIRLVFREDQTGEMRDSDIDTVWLYNDEIEEYDSYIVNPDTTIITTFTFSYDKRESALYVKMKYTYPYTYYKTFMMKVSDLTDNSFTYENEYDVNYVERAFLKRVSGATSKASKDQKQMRPHKEGSLLNGR